MTTRHTVEPYYCLVGREVALFEQAHAHVAVLAARRAGLSVRAFVLDHNADDYARRIFGPNRRQLLTAHASWSGIRPTDRHLAPLTAMSSG